MGKRTLEEELEEMKKMLVSLDSSQKEKEDKMNQQLFELKGKIAALKEDLILISEIFREKREEEKKIAIFIDWDNLYGNLTSLNLAFPSRIVLEEIKNKLEKEIAFAIVFFHRLPFLYSQVLRRDGYWLISCPPLSSMGKDTVDETIFEMIAQLIVKVDFLDPIVIISGDKDMIHPINLLLNAKKKVVLVLLDRQSRLLRDKEGIIKIRLPQISQVKIPETENPFIRYIEIVSQNRVCPINEPLFILFLLVINVLKEKATLEYKRGFENLVQSIWDDLYPLVQEFPELRKAGKREVELIVSSLLDHADILEKVKEATRVFYLFNPRSNFFPKVLSYINQILGQKPEFKSLFLVRGR